MWCIRAAAKGWPQADFVGALGTTGCCRRPRESNQSDQWLEWLDQFAYHLVLVWFEIIGAKAKFENAMVSCRRMVSVRMDGWKREEKRNWCEIDGGHTGDLSSVVLARG